MLPCSLCFIFHLSSISPHCLPPQLSIHLYPDHPTNHAPGMASWKRSLCDADAHDCLQAYFTPFYVFGRTRYRLERIDRHENPLDLEGYKSSNEACWDWFFFALPFGMVCPSYSRNALISGRSSLAEEQNLTRQAGISCSVFTSNEIRRIRELYGIEGSPKKDVITAILCPCCSILRNESEVCTREEEMWNELHGPGDKGYAPEKPMTAALPDGVHSGKENRAPRKDSIPIAPGSSLRNGNGSRRSSASSVQQSAKNQGTQKRTPDGQAAASARLGSNSPSLSLASSGNGETVTCTVIDRGQRHILHLDRGVLTPVTERLSEDTMLTVKKPPLQGENMPLGSIKESSPPDSLGGKSAAVSSPLVSRPTSPRRSVDRPPTPIPQRGAMSPSLSVISGRSGRSFQHKVPLVPVSEALLSPVRELLENGQVPDKPSATASVKTYQSQEPFVSMEPTSATHALSAGILDKVPEARSTTPHVMVEGWLDAVGSPARRKPGGVHDQRLPQESASANKTSNESIVTNATLTPPAFTPMPDESREQGARPATTQDPATETAGDEGEVKPAVQPATALSALGTTIAGALKSLMPATAAAPAANFLEHNVSIPHHPATAPSTGTVTRTSVKTLVPAGPKAAPDNAADTEPHGCETDDTTRRITRGAETANLADRPASNTTGPPGEPTAANPDSSRKRGESASEIPRLGPASPTVPTPAPASPLGPRPAVRVPTGLPLTTTPSSVVAAAAAASVTSTHPTPAPSPGPATPTPPGRYPTTPTAAVTSASTPRLRAGEEGSPFGAGGAAADKAPFVSFRAKQLLGHFLARDAPRGRSVDRAAGARPARGGRGHSVWDDDRVWGTVPGGNGGFEAAERRGWGRGRVSRRGVRGTE